MIDETVLERLLHEEAATYEPPAGGPAAVLAAADGGAPRAPRRGMWLSVAAAAVLVAFAVPLGLRGGGFAPAGTSAMYDRAGSGATGGANDLTDGTGDPGTKAPDAQVDGAHVVRTAELWVEVRERDVTATLRRAHEVAGALGGYVAESSAETAGDAPTGQVTVRVPAAAFEQALDRLGRLGEVKQSRTDAKDVGEEVTDVEARLKSAVASRAQLRTLLARATSVGDVLAVQQRIDEVQTEIEKLQGRQAALKDATGFATVTVTVLPPGALHTETSEGFSKAWDDAVDGFVGGFQALVAASGTLAFLLLVGVAAFFVARKAYRVWVRGVV